MKGFIRYAVSLVFAFSAIMKLVDFQATLIYFIEIINLPVVLIKIGLSSLIISEIVIAYGLAFSSGFKILWFNAAVSMLFAFILINIYFKLQGVSNCGCFGTVVRLEPVPTILKNIVLIGLLIIMRKYDNEN